jgi:vacuolar-type H+-ATPase subunit I/STV1
LYVTTDGEVTNERPEYVDTLSPSEVNRSQELDQLASMADDLHSVAEMRAWDEVESFAEEAREEREREVEIKRKHAKRHFEEEIETWEERLEQYEAQDGPSKDMSAPIGNARQELDELRREREAELSRLDEEQYVTPEEPELVTAAFVVSGD